MQFTGAVLLDTSGSRFVDEEAHGYSSMAGILQQQPGERAAMVYATAMAATRESEMMRESSRRARSATLPTLAALADQLGITVATAEEARAPQVSADGCGRRTTAQTGGGRAHHAGRRRHRPGRPRPRRERRPHPWPVRRGRHRLRPGRPVLRRMYSSGNGLLSAFGMGWIIGNSLAGRPRWVTSNRTAAEDFNCPPGHLASAA